MDEARYPIRPGIASCPWSANYGSSLPLRFEALMPILANAVAIIVCGAIAANAAYMVISPQRWARAEWTAKGKLNAYGLMTSDRLRRVFLGTVCMRGLNETFENCPSQPVTLP